MPKHLRYYALLFQSLFILPMATADEWDWVPKESLNASQQAALNQYCRGAYIDSWQASDGDDTHLLADMIYRDEQGTIHMQGAATLKQPLSQLDATTIEGRPGHYYQAQGDVSLRTKGQLIRSSNAYVSSTDNNQTARFDDAQFLSHSSRLRGEAQQIARTQDGIIFINEGFFTTCEPGSNSWQLYGSSIELDPKEGFGTAKHVQIRIKDIPVFYFPWLRFPIDNRRQSGFLFPSFSYANSNITVSAPIYWNIAENYDATFTPHIVSTLGSNSENKRSTGQGLDIELRHLSPYGETTYEQSTFYDSLGDQGTLRKLVSDQQLTPSFSAGVDLEDNPTENREPEVNTTSLEEKDNYQRHTYAQFNLGNFSSDVQLRSFQTPDPSEDQPLEWRPRINASYRYADQYFAYLPEVQFTDFYEPDRVGVDGQRSVINQDFNVNMGNSWGNVTLGALHQYRDYDLHDYDSVSERQTDINHLSYYLDGRITFERYLRDNDNGAWRQTLEPRFSYLNAPYKDQSLIPDFDADELDMTYAQAFSHRRFSGDDRIGDTEQIALGLESRFYDGNNNNRWTLQGGQVFYLEDRKVGTSGATGDIVDDDSTSAFLTSASYNSDRFSLANHFNYDFDDNRVDLAQSALKYTPDNGFVFNVSFSYVREDEKNDMTKQASFGTIIPLNRNWHFFHQQAYDWVEREETAQVDGFGYENCCIKASFSYQRWRDDDSTFDEGVFLQFILRSLSDVGRTNSDFTGIADDYWNEGKVGY